MKNKQSSFRASRLGLPILFLHKTGFLLILLCLGSISCNTDKIDPTDEPDQEIPGKPFTEIPDELTGTWYAADNDGPLTANWENGTFQGESGFREFRTMVFTKNGKNAVEYSTQVYNVGDEVRGFMYKITGTLEYKSKPAALQFHPQFGTVRLFSSKSQGYKESGMDAEMLKAYFSLLLNPQASYSGKELEARRNDGGNTWGVKYKNVDGATPPSSPGDYSQPPASGSYVQVGKQFYPTVKIGTQEWMSVNYAGPVGKIFDSNVKNGSFIKFSDLKNIPVPDGWRIPTREDYLALLRSQGLQLTEWGSTDGADLESKKLLGRLMASSGWKKEDGYATNASGFNAVPADFRVEGKTSNSEGYNCLLWTSERDASDNPIAFEIIQLPSDTYAKMGIYPVGYYPILIPVRLVRSELMSE